MRALTVCEPFASALIFGGKDIENRQQRIAVHGPTIIQAGKSLDWYTDELCDWVHTRWNECPWNRVTAMHKFGQNHGKAIGVLWFGEGGDLEYAKRMGWDLKWATGPFCLPVCGRAIAIKPFPLRGQQGPFTVPWESLPEDAQAAVNKLTEEFGTP
jgi:hypothetical protein